MLPFKKKTESEISSITHFTIQLLKNKKLNSTTICYTEKNLALDGKMPALNLDIQLDCQPIKKKQIKKISMGKTIKKLFLDESRVWSFAVDKMEMKQLRD